MAKILVVDDDPVTLKVVSFVLKAGGHAVSAAQDGFSALESLKSESFQLVISDVNMPGGFSGFRLASAIKENPSTKHIPVVLLSVRGGKSDVERARKCGVDHYFIKPIQPEPFRMKVSEILARHATTVVFGEAGVREKGLWTNLFMVTAVSERGLRMESPVPLPPGFVLCFACNIFQRIGITTPNMKVESCESSTGVENSYDIKLEFAGLSESDLQSIRVFLNAKKSGAA